MIEDLPRTDGANASQLPALVRPGRVHGDVYTKPEIFELELEKIFHASWLYIGHESEVPAPGDFVLRTMGRQPVILVRGKDGIVRVLMNRCRHRGALVCEVERGREQHFRCWYHGWTYDNTGRLTHVPEPGGYPSDFPYEEYGLSQPPCVDAYRGFVFASLRGGVKPLREHIGLAAKMIDLMIDASPIGEIALDMGCNKTAYNGNWKLVGMDGYHPNYLHVSVIIARAKREAAAAGNKADAEFMNAVSWSDASESVTRDLGNGHSMLDLLPHRMSTVDAYLAELRELDGGAEYIEAMLRAYGPERGKVLLAMAGDPHVGLFPNVQLINNHVRIITPIAVDKTEIMMFPVRLAGVSDAINDHRLRKHESFYGPSAAGSPDDAEIFERTQRGLQARVDPWIDLSRGMHREYVDADGSIVGKITDEVPQRAQMKRWLELMSAPA
jgi:nitrite reductase/ring-hydroxylating ferredoxin subunit